jgi:hypothetical protein
MRKRALLGVLAATAVLATACSDDDDSVATDADTEATATTTVGDEASSSSLADVCPANIVIQTDWFATPERAAAYQLVGPDGEVDLDTGSYRGPLGDTGVDAEVRFGGSFIGFNPIPQQMYTDDSIMLGLVATDDAIAGAEKFPTMAVVAPLELNPQTVMFDPASYEIESWDDVAATGAKLIYVEGLPFMDYLVSEGYVDESQLDASFDGTPARFISEDGKILTQEYGTNEYRWENDYPGWDRPVSSLLVNDAGYEIYPQGYAVRTADLEEYAACLEKLVPVIQQAQVDYMTDPEPTNDTIIRISEEIKQGPTFSPQGNAAATEAMVDLGIVGNGGNETLGDFDIERVTRTIDVLRPIYEARDQTIPADLAPDDLVTNEFIDTSIHL